MDDSEDDRWDGQARGTVRVRAELGKASQKSNRALCDEAINYADQLNLLLIEYGMVIVDKPGFKFEAHPSGMDLMVVTISVDCRSPVDWTEADRDELAEYLKNLRGQE